jgi:glycosyltransferase involved in cell wall biosynthesis
MRIGVDIRTLQTGSGWRGVGVYTRHLVEALMRIDEDNDYFLFAGSRMNVPHLPEHFRRNIIPLKRPSRNIIFWDQLCWHHLLKKWKIDIFHSPFYASPLYVPKRAAVVQTVHDLIPLIFKKSTSFKNRLIFKINFSLLKYADRIIAVSQNTKNDILKILRVPEEKVVVIHNGANHLQKADQDVEKPSKNEVCEECPFILYVGGMDPLKNIPTLIRAFDKICEKHQDLKLVMVGADGEKMKYLKPTIQETRSSSLTPGQSLSTLLEKLIRSGKVVLKGYLEMPDLISYYRNAELFLFPSLYEGFGLPPLEAMSCGLPVVASDRSSLPEVLGEAALYANPEDAEDLARSVDQLLENDSLKAKHRDAGLQRAAQFAWEETARKTLALYQALFEEKEDLPSSEI